MSVISDKTIPIEFVRKPLIGYGVGSHLSKSSQLYITELLKKLNKEIPDSLFTYLPEQLHITLFEILVKG